MLQNCCHKLADERVKLGQLICTQALPLVCTYVTTQANKNNILIILLVEVYLFIDCLAVLGRKWPKQSSNGVNQLVQVQITLLLFLVLNW